jgi:hypothetical protein
MRANLIEESASPSATADSLIGTTKTGPDLRG